MRSAFRRSPSCPRSAVSAAACGSKPFAVRPLWRGSTLRCFGRSLCQRPRRLACARGDLGRCSTARLLARASGAALRRTASAMTNIAMLFSSRRIGQHGARSTATICASVLSVSAPARSAAMRRCGATDALVLARRRSDGTDRQRPRLFRDLLLGSRRIRAARARRTSDAAGIACACLRSPTWSGRSWRALSAQGDLRARLSAPLRNSEWRASQSCSSRSSWRLCSCYGFRMSFLKQGYD